MISLERAERLDLAGLAWRPRSGDRFAIRQPGLAGETFVISDMLVEAHEHPTGTVLGFNGTTEWALDSVAQEDVLWLPREDQLRTMLGGTFRSLTRTADGRYVVVVELPDRPVRSFTADVPEDAYADALHELVAAARV